ncbi:MAG: hypothetical protein ACJ8AO_02975 [Gemmatimonadaceae bacterium]
MQFETFHEYQSAVLAGRIRRGDLVYIATRLYDALTEHQRAWLWRSALDARAQLVTGLDLEPPIIVREGWAPTESGAADVPAPT